MRRREFINLMGWMLASPARVLAGPQRPLSAWLSLGLEIGSSVFTGPFLQGMKELSYIEGRDFDMVYRFAGGHMERLPALAEEVVRLKPSTRL
jgi:putative tryptophan/tyrosine transport system substrate-binding protein